MISPIPTTSILNSDSARIPGPHPPRHRSARRHRLPRPDGYQQPGAYVETVTNSTTGVVESRTNTVDSSSGALSQAVEVLRKRVDQFGVAEPVIQPEGSDRISIQLPGLSKAQMQDDARISIQKAAYLEFYIVHRGQRKVAQTRVSRRPATKSWSPNRLARMVKKYRIPI